MLTLSIWDPASGDPSLYYHENIIVSFKPMVDFWKAASPLNAPPQIQQYVP